MFQWRSTYVLAELDVFFAHVTFRGNVKGVRPDGGLNGGFWEKTERQKEMFPPGKLFECPGGAQSGDKLEDVWTGD